MYHYQHFLLCHTILILSIAFQSASGFSQFSFLNSNQSSLTTDGRPCNFMFEFNEVRLKTPEIARKYGLKFEKHEVFTPDDYVLELHRLPAPGKPPVYLLHGLFQSSRDFLINCNRRALAVRLADEGFDVWIGNLRGNAYSIYHKVHGNEESDYWDFSMDEMVAYDAPATIDYVLNVTRMKKLNWVGYSVGSGILFGLLSSRPEYNSKVNIGFSMGATAIFSQSKSTLIRLLAPYSRIIERMVAGRGNREVIPRYLIAILHGVVPLLCLPEARARQDGLCALGIFLNDGYDPRQIDPRVTATVLGGYPTSVSVRSLLQWFQWITNGNLAYYNYGTLQNLNMYNRLLNPLYELHNVVAPVVCFWGENDFITSSQDVKSTARRLPNVKKVIRVNSSSWNHVDFMYGKDADIQVYDHIIDILRGTYNTLY